MIDYIKLEFMGLAVTFNSYYHDYYLPKHSSKWTKLGHMMGVAFTFAWLGYSVFFAYGVAIYLMLLASPFVVYPFAWLSHLLFEPQGNRVPAALTSNPLWAKASDLRMCYELLTGKLSW